MTPEPYYADDAVTLLAGDCLDVLPTLPDASVDAVVCDPPYGLGFMGKAWDSTFTPGDSPMRRNAAMDAVNTGASRQGGRQRAGDDYAKRQARDSRSYGEWCEQWAAECLRVLKPGGHLLAFGGTRTYHRIACAVEDAGFEIRDSISWLYGSGFPKSLNVGEGRGTALKPAHEPIVVGRKALAGTVAANVLAHGTGALNIDGCRVGYQSETDRASARPQGAATARIGALAGKAQACENSGSTAPSTTAQTKASSANSTTTEPAGTAAGSPRSEFTPTDALGRWPANVLLDESQAAALDEQTGVLTSGILAEHHARAPKEAGILGAYGSADGERGYGDSGGASRFFPTFGEVNTCSESGSGTCMNGEPDGSPSAAGLSTNAPGAGSATSDFPTFRYEAKAGSAERPSVDGVLHPTVKPLDLMRWLVRLVTPRGGLVLDPFLGSGTTAEACVIEGFHCIGIERETTYLPLIVARLSKPIETVLDFGESA